MISSLLRQRHKKLRLPNQKKTHEPMEKSQQQGTPRKPPGEYAGRYYNNIDNFFLDVSVKGDDECVCKASKYLLRHSALPV